MTVTKHIHAAGDRQLLKDFLISAAGGASVSITTIPSITPFTITRTDLTQAAVDQGWPRALVIEAIDTLLVQGRIFLAAEVT